MAKYIRAGNLTAYLDMALIENKSSPTAGYALLKLQQIINEHPDYFGCITLGGMRRLPVEWPSPEMFVLPSESRLKRLL